MLVELPEAEDQWRTGHTHSSCPSRVTETLQLASVMSAAVSRSSGLGSTMEGAPIVESRLLKGGDF